MAKFLNYTTPEGDQIDYVINGGSGFSIQKRKPKDEFISGLWVHEGHYKDVLDAVLEHKPEYVPPHIRAYHDSLKDDNVVVHINMLRGSLAKLSAPQVGHLYRGQEAIDVVFEVMRQNPDINWSNVL